MKSNVICSALAVCLSALSLPSQAIVSCTQPVAASASVQPSIQPNVAEAARALAGMKTGNSPTSQEFERYVAAVNAGWQTYTQSFGQPLRAWAAKEVRQNAGQTVFYPFSGPDLPNMLSVFPAASRFVMISDQYANKYFDPSALGEQDRSRLLREMGDEWARFGQRGFFVTQELNRRGGRKAQSFVNVNAVIMAFAARLGYEVRSAYPICLDAKDVSIRADDSKAARWASIRLELRKDGRDVVVDYIQQDLSNRGLAKRAETRELIVALSKGPVFLKAASHLLQHPDFSVLRDAILATAPIVVQDETGLEYDAMVKSFAVKLYGEYVNAHYSFKEFSNRSLAQAYKDKAAEVRPLDFRLGYQKDAGSAIQVGTRK